ncbi:hypothetical protein H2198_005616 [Neophaeococcomyces mojaviensis]|uniref:Uncharacterized protein n=1 Tax=Neophaeococcomyces mojaviensis TaxID=3383035 RepID=A0ACC3A5C2_9EURO|nr:hypothetical protein H2198_005616 [Knufia sp. JES_112]
MGEVYKYALCNIAATAAPDSTYGCFRNKSGHSATGCSLWIDCEGLPNGVFHCLPEDLWEDKISSAPLNRRAWVVQERLLSPRILHFGADQLYFECCETSACETCPAGLEGDIAPTSKKLELSLCPLPYKLAFDFRRSGEQSDDHLLKFLHAWSEVVTTYSEGKLTREEDKLVALSGLAKEMKSRFCGDIEYLAGLWRQDLAAQLLWSVISKGRKYSLPTTQAPSWSWASIDGLILAGSGTRPDEITLMSVLEAKVNSNGFDTMVHNHDGQLRVKGRLFRAEIAPENPRDLRFSLRRGYVQGTALIACRLDVPTTIRKCGPNIHLMPVKYDWFNKSLKGLILEPTQVVKGQFQRYGTFSASEGSLNTFNNSHEKEEVEYEVYDGINEFVITII